jgi:hypothetical protein
MFEADCALRFSARQNATEFDLTAVRSVVMGPSGLNARVATLEDSQGLFDVFADDLAAITEQAFASL